MTGRPFRFVCYACTAFVLALWLGYALVTFAGCSDAAEAIAPGPEDLAGFAEQYCKDNPTLPCGKVYAFPDQPRSNPLGLLEMCVPQFIDVSAAESLFGPAILSPDPRFHAANLCWWCCGAGCTRGCNAYGGPPEGSCFCPVSEMPPDAGIDAPLP